MSVIQRSVKESLRWRDETQRRIKKSWWIAWKRETFPKPTRWQQVSVQLLAGVTGYAGFTPAPYLSYKKWVVRDAFKMHSGSRISVPSALWKLAVLSFAFSGTDLLFMALSNTNKRPLLTAVASACVKPSCSNNHQLILSLLSSCCFRLLSNMVL